MPMFKKSGGKIFAVQFNKAEERALDQEIKKQIVENDRAFDMDKESEDIEAAVNKALDNGYRTGDIMSEGMTQVTCSEMGDKILANI